MKFAVTGAAGFVGRAVAARLAGSGVAGSVKLIDKVIEPQAGSECLEIDLLDSDALTAALRDVDRVLHLVALPGVAAESNPAISRRVNLDLPLDLIERMEGRRLVYASSIAVFGDSFPAQVDDLTPPVPASVYGTHKRMVELGFADAVRRGSVTGVSLRLPGIVARPKSAEGFGSAFLSDLFHAVQNGSAFTVPVSPDATSWLMSVKLCADNLVHALVSDFTEGASITLAAVRASMEDLIGSLSRYGDASQIDFVKNAETQRLFGSQPPLDAQRSCALGFRADGNVYALVNNVMHWKTT